MRAIQSSFRNLFSYFFKKKKLLFLKKKLLFFPLGRKAPFAFWNIKGRHKLQPTDILSLPSSSAPTTHATLAYFPRNFIRLLLLVPLAVIFFFFWGGGSEYACEHEISAPWKSAARLPFEAGFGGRGWGLVIIIACRRRRCRYSRP